jgi:hypothetical protein
MNEHCKTCGKKVSLLDMIICKCRCGNLYCCKHRIDHTCIYDYSQNYKIPEKLQETKINKI